MGHALADGSLTVPVLRRPAAEVETTAVTVVADSSSPAVGSDRVAPVGAVRPSPYDYGIAAGAVVLLLALLAAAYVLNSRKKSPVKTE